MTNRTALCAIAGVIAITIFACTLTGCSLGDYRLNEDLARQEFCRAYPEVCQYIVVDDD